MKRKTTKNLVALLLYCLIFLTYSCGSCGGRNDRKKTVAETPPQVENNTKISKVVFYLENSGSMFGYISNITEYVEDISELSEKPDFVAEKIKREFYFINGANKQGQSFCVTPIGSNPAVFKSKLNRNGFNCGNTKTSDLNSMFQVALAKAQDDIISILISDAIYDIKQPQSSLNVLATEGRETRSKFITRLENGDLQTLMIKLKSRFDGYYYYSSTKGQKEIHQFRPFYIWIFGKSELLNNYFSEEYISKYLKGYDNYARFLIINENSILYQIVPSLNRKGNFALDRKVKNKIIDAKKDRNGQGFQFTIAVDYSSLPFSDNYLTSIANYHINSNYKIVAIQKVSKKIHEVTAFNPTYTITVYTDKNPYGNLEISLQYGAPSWIAETDVDNENNIDEIHTFGFKYLTDAISEAYSYKNRDKKLATFKIEISN
jgi:hypothetical protein